MSGNTGGGLALTGTAADVLQNTLSMGANTFRNNTVGRLLLLPNYRVLSSALCRKNIQKAWTDRSFSPAYRAKLLSDESLLSKRQCRGVAGQGGGLAFSNLLAITLRDNVFEDNTAAKLGGGMWIAGLPKTETSVSNCT